MSSYGKVLDLLDERYLNLQDVFGNVEPIPELVPYEQYAQTPIVYRMNTMHEIFVGLLQEFTDRTSKRQGKEIWTWFVQWEVEEPTNEHGTPIAKRPRLSEGPGTPSSSRQEPSERYRKPAYTKVERRCLRPDLFLEEDMLRILIDIVQVDSRLVPNFVEFLYQWIDFYEGDGKALHAAVRQEIPSLWLFAEHPRPLTGKAPWAAVKVERKDEKEKVVEDGKYNGAEGKEKDGLEKAADNIGEKFTREKPNIAALEAMTEESERLQYREVKFGLQRPIDPKDEPLPPLINIPLESRARSKYYAACFKNRQRASWLLQEAGISAKQIQNYKKLQKQSPKDTPEDVNGDGYTNYYKDMPYAQEQFTITEGMMRLKEKQKEIAISNRLAEEAREAARSAASPSRKASFDGLHNPPPLIPPTPSYGVFPSLATTVMEKEKSVKRKRDFVHAVSRAVHGKMKSKLYAYAMPTQPAPSKNRSHTLGYRDSSDSDSESDSDDEHRGEDADSDGGPSDEDDDEDSGDPMDITASAHPTLGAPSRPPPLQLTSSTASAYPTQGVANPLQAVHATQSTLNAPHSQLAVLMRPYAPTTPFALGPPAVVASPQHFNNTHAVSSSSSYMTRSQTESPTGATAPAAPNFPAYMQSLNHAQLNRLIPMRNPASQQALHNHPALNAPRQPSAPNAYPGIPQATGYSAGGAMQATGALTYNPNHPVPGSSVSIPTMGFAVRPGLPATTVTPSVFGSAARAQAMRNAGQAQGFSPGPYTSPPSITVTTPSIFHAVSQAQALSETDAARSAHQSFTSSQGLPPQSQNQLPMLRTVQSNPSFPQGPFQMPTQPHLRAQVFPPPPPPHSATIPLGEHQNHNPFAPQDPQMVTHPLGHSQGLPMRPQAISGPFGVPQSTNPFQFQPAPVLAQSNIRAPPPASLTIHPHSQSDTLPSIHRAPSTPSLMTPLAGLANSLSLNSPQGESAEGISIQIYIPRIVLPPGMSNPSQATDCLLLGHTRLGTGILRLSKAIFLPTHVWENTLNRVRKGHQSVLESYSPPSNHPYARHSFVGSGLPTMPKNPDEVRGPHRSLYEKVVQIYRFMVAEEDRREEEVTKRWRASMGPMTEKDRGAVWEGWGVWVDKGVELGREERKGATVLSSVDPIVRDEESEKRMREIEELLEENEEGSDVEMDG